MDTPDTPIVINASPVTDQAAAASRDVLLVVAALPTLIAVLGTHDVQQIVTYVSGAGFAPVLGILVTAGVMIWRQIVTRRHKANLVTAAEAAPNSVAIIK